MKNTGVHFSFVKFVNIRLLMFAPIAIREYVELYMKLNPEENKRQVEERLRNALHYALSGATCACGNPLWVAGAAEAGLFCFTCITGEAVPDDDYEIDEHLNYLKKQGR
jgi:hypothetical protein